MSRTLPVPSRPVLKTPSFRAIAELMHSRYGIDLREGKESLVETRLGRKLRAGGHASFQEYLASVMQDPSGESLIEMVDALTTNHTSFLREQAHFDFLVQTVVPAVPARSSLQVWSAACSSGEEPYSIACTLLDACKGDSSRFSILATDLSTRVLKRAREGCYPEELVAGVPPAWIQRYLTRTTDSSGTRHYRFRPEVSSRIDFRRLNLMEPVQHGRRFHVIFCRNVMMYFDRATQERVIERLSACLEPGGYLFVGHAESLTGVRHSLRYVRPATYVKGSAFGGLR